MPSSTTASGFLERTGPDRFSSGLNRKLGFRKELPGRRNPMKTLKALMALACFFAFAGTAAAADVSYVLETPGVT